MKELLRCSDSLNFRAAQEPRVIGEGSASITSIGKVGHGRSDSVQESNVNNVDVGIYMVTVRLIILPFPNLSQKKAVALEKKGRKRTTAVG
jgi:hypothetical protein